MIPPTSLQFEDGIGGWVIKKAAAELDNREEDGGV